MEFSGGVQKPQKRPQKGPFFGLFWTPRDPPPYPPQKRGKNPKNGHFSKNRRFFQNWSHFLAERWELPLLFGGGGPQKIGVYLEGGKSGFWGFLGVFRGPKRPQKDPQKPHFSAIFGGLRPGGQGRLREGLPPAHHPISLISLISPHDFLLVCAPTIPGRSAASSGSEAGR